MFLSIFVYLSQFCVAHFLDENMSFFEFCRKTVSRVWKRPNTDEEELHPLQDTENHYSSSCYNLHQVSRSYDGVETKGPFTLRSI